MGVVGVGPCGAACETGLGLFGVPGQCVDGACDCPPGYHGRDSWAQFAACNVPIAVQHTVILLNTIAYAAVLLGALLGAGYLLFYWGYVHHPSAVALAETARLRLFDRTHEDSSLSASNNGDETRSAVATGDRRSDYYIREAASRSRKVRRSRRQKAHERLTLLAIGLAFLTAVGALLYYVPMLGGHFRYDEGGMTQDLGIALVASALYSGIWILFYIWYLNLPNLTVYGKLFGVDSFLIRRPRFVQTMVAIRVVYSVIANFLLLFGAYHIFGVSVVETRNKLDTAVLSSCSILATDFVVFTERLTRVLRQLFLQLDELQENANAATVELHKFQRALWTIRFFRWAAILLGLSSVVTFVPMIAAPSMRATQYLVFNASMGIGALCELVVLYLLVSRLKGNRKSRSVQVQVHDTTTQPLRPPVGIATALANIPRLGLAGEGVSQLSSPPTEVLTSTTRSRQSLVHRPAKEAHDDVSESEPESEDEDEDEDEDQKGPCPGSPEAWSGPV